MPLEFDSLPAPMGGTNLVDDPEHINDNEAVYIQDAILDQLGRIRRRGPWAAAGQTAVDQRFITTKVAIDRTGDEYVVSATFNSAASGTVNVTIDKIGFASGVTFDITNSGANTHSSFYGTMVPDNKGNLILGSTISVDSLSDINQDWVNTCTVLSGWNAGQTAVTGTVTATIGSRAVSATSGAFLTELGPGAILLDSGEGYIGTVRSVTDNDNLILEDGAWESASGTGIQSHAARRWSPNHGKGRLTVASSGTAVTGVNTKFLNLGRLERGAAATRIVADDWNLFRRADGVWIGRVSSVADDTTLTLNAGSAVAMVNEPFIARASAGNGTTSLNSTIREIVLMPGWVIASYAGRIFYMNSPATLLRLRINDDPEQSNRVIFSSIDDPEDIDWAPDGDWFDLPSSDGTTSPIIGAQGTNQALLVFKRTETIAITGRTPSEFVPNVVLDDGILHPEAVAPYGNGAIWAGRENIWQLSDGGIQPLLTDSLGMFYKELVKNSIAQEATDDIAKQAYLNISRDHVFLFLDNANPNRGTTKLSSTTTPTKPCIVLNLQTGAVNFWTNSPIRGMFTFTEAAGSRTYALMDKNLADATVASTEAYSVDNVFDTTGDDDDGLEDETAGPNIYWETKRWSRESEFGMKKLKRLRQQYTSTGGTIEVEVITGKERGDVAGTSIGTLAASTTFIHDDILLSPTVDNWIGFRLYENASVTAASFGEMLLMYKQQRMTRT